MPRKVHHKFFISFCSGGDFFPRVYEVTMFHAYSLIVVLKQCCIEETAQL